MKKFWVGRNAEPVPSIVMTRIMRMIADKKSVFIRQISVFRLPFSISLESHVHKDRHRPE